MAFYQCVRVGGGGTGDVADVEVNGVSVLDPDDKIAKITSYEEVTESEYEAIPVAERESNGIAYFIKDLNNESVQGYPPLIYSDEEREIGVWRDGKPLYQKTVHVGALVQDSSWHSVSHGVANLDKCIKVEAICIATNGTEFYSINLYRPTTSVGVMIYTTASDIYYMNNYYSEMDDTYVTIRYTKTTDTAGSGIWNGQGGIAHHYSTNETVIGTWINGKPIYQRVITGLSIGQSSGTSYTIPIPSPDLEQIIDSTLMSTLTQYKSMTHPPTWISNSSNLAIRSQESDTYDTFIIAYTKTTD